MGLGTKAFLVGAILTFYSSIAAALGLGEITLNSALNQPLDAEIELLHVRDLSEREIRVGLASSEEFARAGVDRGYFLSDLRFEVKLNAEGGPQIQVTSERPVREPFLNFLVSARWPSGKLLREYTLLVDLPVFSDEQAAPVQAAPRGQTERAQRTPTNTPTTTAGSSSTRPTASGDDYGPVGANENLWSIAANVRPDSSVTVQQTMLALQRLNPEAFINNNINLLRRGQVLRVPSKNEIQALSPREAISEVANQNRRWSDRGAADDQPAAQLEGSRNLSPTRTEPSAPEGRVSLSSSSAASATGEASGGDEGEAGGVQRQLAVTQEELDAASRENEDLQSRLSAVEEQIETMEKLVEVSSEELRALELAAQQSNEAEESAPVESAVTPTQEEVVEAEPQVTEEQPAEQEPAEQTPAQTAPTAASSWLDMLLDNALYLAIGLGVLLALVALWLYKRGGDDGFDDEFDEEFSADFENDYDPTLAVAPIDEESSEATPALDRSDADEAPEEDIFANEAETEDVVGESDIHIAYGQYDQAEEKLTRALQQDPNNTSVRMKLLEVFAAQGDVENFDRHFAEVHAANDQTAIDRAAGLRSTMAGVAAFSLAAHTAASDNAALNQSERGATADSGFDSEASADELDGADDTLDFDFENIDAVVESSDEDFAIENDELSLDLAEADESAFDQNEDATVLQDREHAGDRSNEELALDEEDSFAIDYTSGDEQDSELQQELDSSLDAIEDTTAIVGDEEATAAAVAVNPNRVKDDSALLDDLDFDLDEINADLSFDDVELDLEFAGFESLADDEDDTTRIAEPKNSFDLPEDDASELAVPAENNDEAEFSFDESLAPLDSSAEADAAVEYKFGDEETLVPERYDANETIPEDFEFDLEKDVESAVRSSDSDADSELDAGDLAGLEADFNDLELGEIEIDDEQIEGGEATFDLATDEQENGAANLAGVPLTGDANEDEPEALAQELSDAEQESELAGEATSSDENLDFDTAVDLDDLDRDLSELSPDLNDDLSSSEGVMEEPETDFGEPDDLDLPEHETDTLAAVEDDAASSGPQTDAQPASGAGETAVGADVEPEEYSAAADAHGDFDIPDFDPESDDDSGLDFLSDNDETATKLDLARAYIDMGDADGAKDILDEIVEEGNAQQKQEAETLLSRLA